MSESHTGNRVVIADLPIEERPRERMMRRGAVALSDAELLAILLAPGTRGRSAMDLAYEVLSGGLGSLARKEWPSVSAVGRVRAARIAAALELGRRVSCLPSPGGVPVDDTSTLAPFLMSRYGHYAQERLGAIYLDSRKRMLREREIYIGTLTSANVSTRDVLRFALEENAAAAIVFHNHPSGDPSPSADDVSFTRKLVDAANVLGVEVIDHLIVSSYRHVSLKQQGLM